MTNLDKELTIFFVVLGILFFIGMITTIIFIVYCMKDEQRSKYDTYNKLSTKDIDEDKKND
jgi:hypothetical protein